MGKITAALTLLVLIQPVSARADSDGYFCAGRGYLAYETRFAERPTRHFLHVVRFGPELGIVRARPVPLDDFQVHRMSCGTTVVELQGWNLAYSVDISNPDKLEVVARSAAFNPSDPGGQNENLGHWAKETVVDLDTNQESGRFQLVISRVSRRVRSGIEHYTITEVIERGSQREITRSLRLFAGIFLETAD